MGERFIDRYRERFKEYPRLVYLGATTDRVIGQFRKDQCLREANAMAYRTLFSAVPLLGIFIAIFTAFGVFDKFLTHVLDFLTTYLVPTAKIVLQDYMVQMAGNTRTLSGVGLVATVVLALYLFNAIELSFNRVWDVTEKRGFIRKFTAFTAILLWAPILFGLSFYMTGVIQAHLPWLKRTVEVGMLSRMVLRLLPVFFTWAALSIMYTVVPYTKVNYRPAAIGALIASVGWELVKLAFNYYVIRAVNYSKIYGSLSVIPIFIVGIYLLWLVVFIGVEIVFVLHNYRFHEDWLEEDWTGYKPYLAIGVMVEIGGRFMEGEYSPSLERLSKEFRVAIPILRNILEDLTRGEILIKSDRDIYYPARDLHKISLEDLMGATVDKVSMIRGFSRSAAHILERLKPQGADLLVKTFESVQREHHAKLGGITLGDLFEGNKSEPEAIELAREAQEGELAETT